MSTIHAVLPVSKKPRRYIEPPCALSVEDALSQFARPESTFLKTQILRPFSVYSSTAYSSVMILPIGPAYIAAALDAAGYEVDIIDSQGEGIMGLRSTADGRHKTQGWTTEEIIQRIDPDAGVLGVSLMFSQEWPLHCELLRQIHAAYPDLTIIAGGEHSTAMPELVLGAGVGIKYVVKGEGEMPFLELVHKLAIGESPQNVGGLAYLDADGRLVDNGLSRRVIDIDNLPGPAWHLCNVNAYFSGNWSAGIGRGRNMPILATRGCPYQCTFCSNPSMWTMRYLMRDPVKVVDEIEQNISQYQTNSIDFADLTAVVRAGWILDFCHELGRRGLNISWQLPSGTRSEALNEDTLRALLKSGCAFLVFAPESGSQETLDQVRKRLDLDNIVTTVGAAVRVGHTVKVNYIIGLPEEGRRSIWKTVRQVIQMALKGAHDRNVAIFTPYPGSELYRELRSSGEIPDPDDAYFDKLLVQFDFTIVASHCRAVPGWELAIYRFIAMASFYSLAYLLHPGRIWRVVRQLRGASFQANNLFEQRVHDFLVRRRMGRR